MWDERARDLGYTDSFLSECGLNNNRDDYKRLFCASCGSGCPLQLAQPEKGETVVDYGCGAGHDVILASHIVGSTGTVVGVDMTLEMIQAARRNVSQYFCYDNVSFVHASLEDSLDENMQQTADVVISNGVFNLVDDKRKAFASAFQTLKPGGRLCFSDLCQVTPNPNAILATSSVTDS